MACCESAIMEHLSYQVDLTTWQALIAKAGGENYRIERHGTSSQPMLRASSYLWVQCYHLRNVFHNLHTSDL